MKLKPSHHRLQQPLIRLPRILLLLLSTTIHLSTANSSSSFGTRHSYSLTTFDPSGNLDQVVHAIRASTLGVPIVALCLNGECNDDLDSTDSTSSTSSSATAIPKEGGIYLSIPLHFISSSPLITDDATPRIMPLTSKLILLHSGITSDGRALSDIAMQLSLDYRYLYGQEIQPHDLLSGLSSKMQEMTVKPGCRPYGCALLVCSLGEDGRSNAMYRVDPSGAVVSLSSVDEDIVHSEDGTSVNKSTKRRRSVSLLGNWESIRQTKKELIQHQLETRTFENEEQIQEILVEAARRSCDELYEASTTSCSSLESRTPVLFASFCCERGLDIKRIITL
ncbi:hypothetical protein ACHAXN_008618 [Cyclotella atomus]